MRSQFVAWFAFGLSIACGGSAVARSSGDLGGLDAGAWADIRAAYEAGRHAVFDADGEHQARNPAQRWTARFDARGFVVAPDDGDWTWGLELAAWGRAGAERDATVPRCVAAVGPRVAYEWDGALTEWFVNDARGLEHGFTVSERPEAGRGSLRFALAIRGGVAAEVAPDGRDVRFVDGCGRSVVTYTGLSVVDADGHSLAAAFEASASGLVLTVDDTRARYPLTIDPIAQQAYVKASNTGGGDNFGHSVAVSGDTVVVGAPLEDSSATGVGGDQADNGALSAGAVYVFVRNAGTWSQQAYLKASNTDAGDSFGTSVAISGDTIIVGADKEDGSATGVNGNQASNSAMDAGAAYVFVRSGTAWSQQAYLKASNTESGDAFGISVGVSGDTIVVGAFQEESAATGVDGNQGDNSAPYSGAAYVFARSGTTWSQQAYLKASNTDSGDGFGMSVSVSGDTVVVGAVSEDSDATGVNGNQSDNGAATSGAAYVFTRTGSIWSQQAYLKASNTDAADEFGGSVSLSADSIIVGAKFEKSSATGVNGNQLDNSGGNAGAAYVFVRSGTVWSQQAYLKASNTGAGDVFGTVATISGDVVVVGARAEDSNATGVNGDQANNAASNSGAAYAFARHGTTWRQVAYLKASNTGNNDDFGHSVAASAGLVVVGARYEDSNATGIDGSGANNFGPDSGAAYAFDFGDCITDSDGDGVADCIDNCDTIANPGQEDCDLDGEGDACELFNGTQWDSNQNGTPDQCEGCPAIIVYCTAGTTTNGCNASMTASGTPSVAATSGFVLTTSNVEGQRTGLIFYGITGPKATPWGGGSTSYVCVRAPNQRTGSQSSGGTDGGCDGAYSLDWLDYVANNPGALGTPFGAGSIVNAQAWFRDPSAPQTTNLSDAVQFTTCP